MAPAAASAPPAVPLRRVLILKSDRLYGELLRHWFTCWMPGCDVTLRTSAAEAVAAMRGEPFDLLLTGVVGSDGGLLDALRFWMQEPYCATRILVVTARREPAVLQELFLLRTVGVLDQTTEDSVALMNAARDADPVPYWSPEFRKVLAAECHCRASTYQSLTTTERMVLGVIGDGCDDAAAARLLPFTESTITTVRRALHRKLSVQQKGDLIDRAAKLGFVIRTSFGVLRPGLSQLIASHRSRRTAHDLRPLAVTSVEPGFRAA